MTSTANTIDEGFDAVRFLARKMSLTDPGTRTLLTALIVLNVFTFFIFITHHLLHNHGLRLPWVNPNDQVHHGRWFTLAIFWFTNAADMPVFIPVVSILVNITGALAALKVWRFDLSTGENFIVAGLITVCPVFLAPFYYTWSTPLFVTGAAFAVFAVYFARSPKMLSVAIGAFFVMLSMATYQPALSVFATMAVSGLIADLIVEPDKPLRGHFASVLSLGLSGAVGGIAYLISVRVTGAASHATSTISLSELPDRIRKVIDVSYKHLTFTQPELLGAIKTLLIVIMALGLFAAIFKLRKSFLRIGLAVVYAAGLVMATKAMFLISSDNNFYTYRYNLSLAFMYAFAPAVLLHVVPRGILRAAVIVLLSFVLLRFVQADLVRQEVLLRGQQHDIALANRILARIEAMPELDFSKTYDLVRVGKYSSFRRDILSSSGHAYDMVGDSHMDNGEITDRWADEDIFILLGSKLKFKHRHFDPGFVTKVEELRPMLENRKTWPAPESVFITGDMIVVYMQ